MPSSPATATLLRHDLAALEPGEMARLVWDNKRVLVLMRERGNAATRLALNPHLLDPDSDHGSQPAFAENPHRSARPEFFIALDYGTDLNCELDYIGPGAGGPGRFPWQGGFRDRCRGSWYDDAGRVYKGQRALRNLAVPPYRIEGEVLILGAE